MPERIWCGEFHPHGPHDDYCLGFFADPDLIKPADRLEGVTNALFYVVMGLVLALVVITEFGAR